MLSDEALLIRHYWEGPVACKDPVYGRWGGPPGQGPVSRRSSGPGAVQPAEDLANAPRGRVKLGDVVRSPLPALDIKGSPHPLRRGEKRDQPPVDAD